MGTPEKAATRVSERAPSGKATAGATASARESIWTRNFVLICLVNLLAMGGFQTVMPTMPMYVKSLGGQESVIGLIMGIFALSALAARPWSGRWMDRVGRRGIYLLGLVAAVPVFLAYSVVPTILWLGALRLIHGLSFGIVTTGGGTIVADAVPPTRRGEGIGYYGMFTTLTSAIGPTVGIVLVNSFGFGTLFVANAAIALVAVLLAGTIHYRPVPAKVEGPPPAYFERRAFSPSAIALCGGFTTAAILTFLPVHALQRGVGNIGPYFAVYALTMLLVRPVAGRFYDERGPAVVVVPGLLIAMVAMLLVAAATNLETFLLAAVLMGLSTGAVHPTLQAMSVDGVPPERRGAANSTYFSSLDIGIGGGSILLGVVAQAFGYPVMYVVAGALAACGVVLFGILRPTRSAVGQPA
ncbi:MAG: MFS transporter [Chloroflexi bacterium]|nr:MFS transporter [Chloroflexota bacterium]